jgi:hypothetical protein
MKKQILLSLLLVVPLLTMAQTTYVPDDNFEAYLENNGMGDGIWGNDYVLTANINTVTYLDLFNNGIASLEGIEGFAMLDHLSAPHNYLTTLDMSSNTLLEQLVVHNNSLIQIDVSSLPNLHWFICSSNNLISLNISNCINLKVLECHINELTTLDASGLSNLEELVCHSNNISHLDITGCTALESLRNGGNNQNTIDVSTNINLTEILCGMDSLTHLDVSSCPNLKNIDDGGYKGVEVGMNIKLTYLNLQNGDPIGPYAGASYSSNLTCVQVNDVAYANANFTYFDNGVYFDLNCPPVGLEEEVIAEEILKDRKLVRIVDVLGRNVNPQKKTLMLYIYDDGSVEKKVIID